MIPKHFHLIWMGKKFPFVNRLAIESIRQYHPNIPITLHYLDPPDNEHWHGLKDLVEFKEIDIDDLLAEAPNPSGVRGAYDKMAANYPAGKSNVLRYLILHRFGGVYLDFDVIVLQNMEHLFDGSGFIGEETVFKCDDDRVKGTLKYSEFIPAAMGFGISWGLARINGTYFKNSSLLNQVDLIFRKLWAIDKLNNAVLGCCAQSAFFKRVLELIPETDPSIRFNLGPILMNRVWDENPQNWDLKRLSKNYFYAIPPSQTARFFLPYQNELPQESVLVHWCSSNEKSKAALLEESYLKQDLKVDSVLFHQLAQKILK
jgi:hypothetical protein